ncbi:phosphatase PAP2 family protein [Longimycelium tulufanense]|uniref:phosphatase PAP2 family protein n=1 Tax=Longimycelium tulufanense TaxID=907463 RepID=UPI00166CA38C|nr:phosphatase PAP2 family protein [Longimycelium tulufanense]
MTTEKTAGSSSPARLLAFVGTEVLSPYTVVCLLPLAIAWHDTRQLGPTLGWGLFVAALTGLVPLWMISRGARRGRWEGHHVDNREGRLVPLLIAVGSLALALVGQLALDGPRELLVMTYAELALLSFAIVITKALRWKISLHAAVSTGAVAMVLFAYGGWLGPIVLAVPLICWSRVYLGKHTTAQVLAGVGLGAVVAGLVYGFLL